MNLSDLQVKEIISIDDGKKLGHIVDVNVDNVNNSINYFVAEQRKLFRKIFGNTPEIKFTLNDIQKIGADVILVKL